MNKKVSRRLSMVLAMVMMFSCVVLSNVSAMAATKTDMWIYNTNGTTVPATLGLDVSSGVNSAGYSNSAASTIPDLTFSNGSNSISGVTCLQFSSGKTLTITPTVNGDIRFYAVANNNSNKTIEFNGSSTTLQGRKSNAITALTITGAKAGTTYNITTKYDTFVYGASITYDEGGAPATYSGIVTVKNNSSTIATVTVNNVNQEAAVGESVLTFTGLADGTYPITVDAAHELSGDTSVTISNGDGNANVTINDKSTGGDITETTTETTTDVPVETTTEAPVSSGTLYKFYVNADDATSNGDNQGENATNIFTDAKTGTNSLSASSTVTIEGKSYTFSKRGSNAAHVISISVPDNVTGATLYIVANSSGSGTRTLTLKDSSGAEAGTNSVAGTTGQLFSFSGLSTGTYTLTYGGNGGYSFLALSVPSVEKPTSDNKTDVIEGDVIANAKAVEIYGDVLSGVSITENTLFARLIGAVNAKGSDELSGIDKVGFTFVNADMVDAWEAASGQKYNPNINESATSSTGSTVAAPSLKIDVETSNVYDAVYSIENYDASKVVNGRYTGEADASAGVTEGRTYFEVLVYGSTDMRVYAYAYTNYAGSQTKTYTDSSGNPSVQVINISNGVISVSAKQ